MSAQPDDRRHTPQQRQAVAAGSTLTARQIVPVFALFSPGEEVADLAPGQQVIADGPPRFEGDREMVAIKEPPGYVELHRVELLHSTPLAAAAAPTMSQPTLFAAAVDGRAPRRSRSRSPPRRRRSLSEGRGSRSRSRQHASGPAPWRSGRDSVQHSVVSQLPAAVCAANLAQRKAGEQLQARVSDRGEQSHTIVGTQAEIDHLRESLQRAVCENKKKEEEFDHLRESLHTALRENKNKQEELDSLQEEFEVVVLQAEASQQERTRQEKEIQELHTRLAVEIPLKAKAVHEQHEKNEEFNNIGEELDRFQPHKMYLFIRANAVDQESIRQEKEIQKLQSTLSEEVRLKDTVSREKNEIREELTQKGEIMDRLREHNSYLRARAGVAIEENIQHEEEIQKLQSTLSEEIRLKDAVTRERDEIREELTQKGEILDSLREHNSYLHARAGVAIEVKKKQQEKEIQKLQSTLSEEIRLKDTVIRERDEIREELTQKGEILDRLQKRVVAFERKLQDMSTSSTCFAPHGIQWQYFDGIGSGRDGWLCFSPEDNGRVHAAYEAYQHGSGVDGVKFGPGDTRRLDFLTMRQTNLGSRRKRNVRLKLLVPSTWSTPPDDLLQQQYHLKAWYHEEDSTQIRNAISELLKRSAHGPFDGSTCHKIKQARICSIHRIENFKLWQKYRVFREEIQAKKSRSQGRAQCAQEIGTVSQELKPLTSVLDDADYPLDNDVNEKWLWHGTKYAHAEGIADTGFDHRLSKTDMYGKGTYFTSQACKSHQYTCALHPHQSQCCGCPDITRWLILARVVLGDAFETKQTCKTLTKPPSRGNGIGDYDSIIANPGPMAGHKRRDQLHQEFVIFQAHQAYPAFVIGYTV